MFLYLAGYQIIDVANRKKQVMIAVRAPHVTAKLNPNMMALHSGSQVFVRKDDILKIFCDRPALYAARLAALVFGEDTLRNSKMSEDNDPKFAVLDEEVLESIISELLSRFHKISLINLESFSSSCGSGVQATEQNSYTC